MKRFLLCLLTVVVLLPFEISASAELDLDDNVPAVWALLRDEGYSETACAAIIGNLHFESRTKTYRVENYNCEDSKAVADAVTKDKRSFLNYLNAYGLAGWTGYGKHKKMWEWFEENEYPLDSLEGQVKFLVWDYEKTQPNSRLRMDYYEPADIVTATEDFRQSYERSICYYPHQYYRAVYAKAVYLECSENPETFDAVNDAPMWFEIYQTVKELNKKIGIEVKT